MGRKQKVGFPNQVSITTIHIDLKPDDDINGGNDGDDLNSTNNFHHHDDGDDGSG